MSRLNGAHDEPPSVERETDRRTLTAQGLCSARSLSIVPVVTSSSCGLLSWVGCKMSGSAEGSTSPDDISSRAMEKGTLLAPKW
jgi:hypothetical protein